MKNTALITGASGGIGYELAIIHAHKGGDLVLIARNETRLQEIKNELSGKFGIEVLVISKDLSIPTAPLEIFEETEKLGIQTDYLINNAGFGDYGFFYETDWSKEAQMIDLNVRALTEITKRYLPGMVKRKSGKILNVASTASFQPGPLMSIYYATKHYVLAFSEGIANELKGKGVTVTALCPGPTETGFQDTASLNESKLFKIMKPAKVKDVAEYGYKSMMKGKVVAIHGLMNSVMARSVGFIPRGVVRNMVRSMQEKG